MVALEDCAFKSYFGNYDEYKREREKRIAAPVKDVATSKKQRTEAVNDEDVKANALAKIERLEKELSELEAAMAEANLKDEELSQIYGRKVEVIKKPDASMELWTSLDH
ncbi:hypothetical protein AB1K32_18340 [Metabacillus dongyingensis]|uniref:hypothetical protein n=1 Tax=Metabacillus dongyingensis TaxID=2874282 RepID=UPI003B8D6235